MQRAKRKHIKQLYGLGGNAVHNKEINEVRVLPQAQKAHSIAENHICPSLVHLEEPELFRPHLKAKKESKVRQLEKLCLPRQCG